MLLLFLILIILLSTRLWNRMMHAYNGNSVRDYDSVTSNDDDHKQQHSPDLSSDDEYVPPPPIIDRDGYTLHFWPTGRLWKRTRVVDGILETIIVNPSHLGPDFNAYTPPPPELDDDVKLPPVPDLEEPDFPQANYVAQDLPTGPQDVLRDLLGLNDGDDNLPSLFDLVHGLSDQDDDIKIHEGVNPARFANPGEIYNRPHVHVGDEVYEIKEVDGEVMVDWRSEHNIMNDDIPFDMGAVMADMQPILHLIAHDHPEWNGDQVVEFVWANHSADLQRALRAHQRQHAEHGNIVMLMIFFLLMVLGAYVGVKLRLHFELVIFFQQQQLFFRFRLMRYYYPPRPIWSTPYNINGIKLMIACFNAELQQQRQHNRLMHSTHGNIRNKMVMLLFSTLGIGGTGFFVSLDPDNRINYISYHACRWYKKVSSYIPLPKLTVAREWKFIQQDIKFNIEKSVHEIVANIPQNLYQQFASTPFGQTVKLFLPNVDESLEAISSRRWKLPSYHVPQIDFATWAKSVTTICVASLPSTTALPSQQLFKRVCNSISNDVVSVVSNIKHLIYRSVKTIVIISAIIVACYFTNILLKKYVIRRLSNYPYTLVPNMNQLRITPFQPVSPFTTILNANNILVQDFEPGDRFIIFTTPKYTDIISNIEYTMQPNGFISSDVNCVCPTNMAFHMVQQYPEFVICEYEPILGREKIVHRELSKMRWYTTWIEILQAYNQLKLGLNDDYEDYDHFRIPGYPLREQGIKIDKVLDADICVVRDYDTKYTSIVSGKQMSLIHNQAIHMHDITKVESRITSMIRTMESKYNMHFTPQFSIAIRALYLRIGMVYTYTSEVRDKAITLRFYGNVGLAFLKALYNLVAGTNVVYPFYKKKMCYSGGTFKPQKPNSGCDEIPSAVCGDDEHYVVYADCFHQMVTMPKKCYCNAIKAIKNRQNALFSLYCPNEAIAMLRWSCQNIQWLIPWTEHNSWSDEKWVNTLVGQKKKIANDALAQNIITGNVDQKHQEVKAFIKVEPMFRKDYRDSDDFIEHNIDPRLISGRHPEYNAMFAPIVKSVMKLLSEMWTEDKNITFYSTGCNRRTVGKWMDRQVSRARPHFYNADYQRFDASTNQFLLALEHLIETAIQNADEEFIQWLNVQFNTDGKCSYGNARHGGIIRYWCWATRKSGDNNTSLGNTLLNIMLIVYALSKQTNIRKLFDDDRISIVVLGDDTGICTDGWLINEIQYVRTLRQLGLIVQLQQKNQWNLTFCSSYFVPAIYDGVETHVLTQKPGRSMCKGYLSSQHYKNDAAKAWVKQNAEAYVKDFGHMPFMHNWHLCKYNQYKHIGHKINIATDTYTYQHLVIKASPSRYYETFMMEVYGIYPDELQHLNNVMNSLTVDWHDATIKKIIDVDILGKENFMLKPYVISDVELPRVMQGVGTMIVTLASKLHPVANIAVKDIYFYPRLDYSLHIDNIYIHGVGEQPPIDCTIVYDKRALAPICFPFGFGKMKFNRKPLKPVQHENIVIDDPIVEVKQPEAIDRVVENKDNDGDGKIEIADKDPTVVRVNSKIVRAIILPSVNPFVSCPAWTAGLNTYDGQIMKMPGTQWDGSPQLMYDLVYCYFKLLAALPIMHTTALNAWGSYPCHRRYKTDLLIKECDTYADVNTAVTGKYVDALVCVPRTTISLDKFGCLLAHGYERVWWIRHTINNYANNAGSLRWSGNAQGLTVFDEKAPLVTWQMMPQDWVVEGATFHFSKIYNGNETSFDFCLQRLEVHDNAELIVFTRC